MRNTKANGKVPQDNEDDTRLSEKPKNICLFLRASFAQMCSNL